MFYISYFINAQSYYHNIKPKTFYIRGLGASPFFFSHHAPPPLVEVMSKSQTSKGCVLGVENRENKNSWLMTTWPLLLQIRLTSNNLPESFFPIFVSGIHWLRDFSLKLVFQSSFYFLINSILADLQDVSPVVTTSAIVGYGMQHCCAIVMRTPVTNKNNDDTSQGVINQACTKWIARETGPPFYVVIQARECLSVCWAKAIIGSRAPGIKHTATSRSAVKRSTDYKANPAEVRN